MGRDNRLEQNSPKTKRSTGSDGTDTPGARDLWVKTLSAVRKQVTPDSYEKWLEPVRFVAEVHDAILISAKDQLTMDRVTAEFARPLQREWDLLDPRDRRLKFQLWNGVSKDIRAMVGDPWAVVKDTAPSVGKLGEMSFETLVTGASNTRSVGIAQRVAQGAPIPAGIVVIYGQPGTGKTHTMKAIQHAVARANDGRRLTYISAEEFMTRFVDGARAGDTKELQAFVKRNDILLIDDLHWIAGKTKTEKAFFGAVRAVTSEGGHVVITADAAPGDMVGLSKELSAEIRGGAAVEVGMPDLEMRKEIVRRHASVIAAATPNFVVTETMVERIVAAIRGPGRELCGVLWSLQLETGYGELAPTPEMLETVIRRIAGEPRAPSLDDIKRSCMDLYSLSKSDIESASKVRTICYPRQLAMYLSRVMTDKSYPQIAAAYKKKDHTTCLHAYRKFNKGLKQNDPDIVGDIERARQAVFDRVAGAESVL